ncbi:hypothetical protein M758_UG232700 [Ceratodon purpureus]|nr:hypothetical protein M758_UG232700 [Ceratodon purpureus]
MMATCEELCFYHNLTSQKLATNSLFMLFASRVCLHFLRTFVRFTVISGR